MADVKEVDAAAIAAVRAAWECGCPVAGDDAESIAQHAIRRWNSRHRRAVDRTDLDASVTDLANGLVQQMGDKASVGPLFEDYVFLAQHIAASLGADIGRRDVAAILETDDSAWPVVVDWACRPAAESKWRDWSRSQGVAVDPSDLRVDVGRSAEGDVARYRVRRRVLDRLRFRPTS